MFYPNTAFKMTVSDYVTSALSATIVVAILGDVTAIMHLSSDLAQMLSMYSEWYTKGVGAVVVTVNAYLVYRKWKRSRRDE